MLVRVTVLYIYICAYVAHCLFMPVRLYVLVCSCYCVCAVVALEWNMDIFHGAGFTERVFGWAWPAQLFRLCIYALDDHSRAYQRALDSCLFALLSVDLIPSRTLSL